MGIGHSNLLEKQPEGIVSIYDVALHVLGQDDLYDRNARRPVEQDVYERGSETSFPVDAALQLRNAAIVMGWEYGSSRSES
jgi:hypothetical protein